MPNHLTSNPAAPHKRIWATPELILISHNDVTTGGKNHTRVHEGTGTFNGSPSGHVFFYNKLGSALVNHKSSAAS